jgi:Raf kinase inhibitor-like YbhB/YbcL family protein
MKVWSDSFSDGEAIPEAFAFGKKDAESHVALAGNQNPHLAWSDAPDGTKSLAIVCVDPDVPSRGDDVNQEGRTVSASLARVDFFHWVLVDLEPWNPSIPAGAFSVGVTARGKDGPDAPLGARQGTNNYTQWFEGDADMAGSYFGYDGPCPPWNDELLHHYVFTVYALDVARLGVDEELDGPAVLAAMEGHILGQASTTGTYTLNPAL